MFNYEYYPEDVTAALCRLAGKEPTEQEEKQYMDAVYYLHSICENNLNNEYFRAFYNLLEHLTEKAAEQPKKPAWIYYLEIAGKNGSRSVKELPDWYDELAVYNDFVTEAYKQPGSVALRYLDGNFDGLIAESFGNGDIFWYWNHPGYVLFSRLIGFDVAREQKIKEITRGKR